MSEFVEEEDLMRDQEMEKDDAVPDEVAALFDLKKKKKKKKKVLIFSSIYFLQSYKINSVSFKGCY